MQTSSPARPCPCCGRTRDSDCRWNDTTILCHQGQSQGPPSHLKRGDTINIGGKQWAVIRFDGGFAGCAMVLKPHRGKARSRAYSRLLGGTAPPMDMDPPSFDLLTDMPELDLARLEALQQANRYDAIFMDSITTLLGMCGDGPKMTDVDFGFVLYELNKWADENNVLLVMTSHLRKQAKDAVSNNVRISDLYGAGSQTWAASDVWALWRVEDNDPSYETHLMLRCLKGRSCEIDTAWHLDGCKEDFSHRVVSVVDPSDLLPLKAVAIKEQALALIIGSGKKWTDKEISQAIACNKEHARRTLQSLLLENKITRHKIPSAGGRPRYAYAELDFSYTPEQGGDPDW